MRSKLNLNSFFFIYLKDKFDESINYIMVRCLIIGDTHIPRRAKDVDYLIYNKLTELANDNLFDFTLFTGDEIQAPIFIGFLESKTKTKLYRVIGNMDYFDGNRDSPVYADLYIYFSDDTKITIGLTHGAQIEPRGDHKQLKALAIEKSYNILISGHTHHDSVRRTKNGILLLNPGSVTGAWSFVASGIPSFITLDINEEDKSITLDLFKLDRKSGQFSEVKYSYIYHNNQIHSNF